MAPVLLATGSFLFVWFAWKLFTEWILAPGTLARACKQQGIAEWSGQSVTWLQQILRSSERSLLRCWDSLLKLRGVFFVCMGKTVRLVLCDPLLVRELLLNNEEFYTKSSLVREVGVFGDGLFSSSGEAWAHQRPLLAPLFHNKELKPKVPTIVESTKAALQQFNLSQEVDFHQFFLHVTLGVLQKSVFGAELQVDPAMLLEVLSRYMHKIMEFVYGLPSVVPGYRCVKMLVDNDEATIRNIMKETIDSYDKSHTETDKQSRLVLDALLRASDMTRQEVLDNSVTILLAGHETTARLLTWTVYLLALYPHWQHEARKEVIELVGDEEVRWEDIGQLKTLKNILMEAARLFPPQPVLGRTCLRRNKLGDYVVLPGVEIIIPVAAIHRSEEFWGGDAAEFKPVRFSKGINGACSQPAAYLPFGTGPRTCIGQGFAMMEAKVVLATMLQTCSWELSESYRHLPDITLTLQPKFGMPIRVETFQGESKNK